MKLELPSIPDLRVIGSHRVEDPRGSFLNTFRSTEREYSDFWADRTVSQVNISSNIKSGTIRGLHFQKAPYSDAKIVRCIKGIVWDVIVDLRKDSPLFGSYYPITLSSQNLAVFIPEGCAHGFQTLTNDCEILYIHSASWKPDYESGIRFDDPVLDITWPLPPLNLSQRDLSLPSFNKL